MTILSQEEAMNEDRDLSCLKILVHHRLKLLKYIHSHILK